MSKEKTVPDSNSVKSDIEVGIYAGSDVDPPDGIILSKRARIFFDEIIAEKAKADWTPHQITFACMLARFMEEMDINQEELSKEGSVIDNGKGIRENPRINISARMIEKITMARRSLGIHALVGGKWIGKIRPHNIARKNRQDEIEEACEDGELLA